MNYDNNPFAAYNKLWCDLANARLEVDRWKQLYANEMERNLSNVANADLQFAEMQVEITRLCEQFRRAGGCARDQHTTQYCGELQAAEGER